MCSHTKQTRAESSYSKLGKLDGLVWQTGLSGFVDSDEGVLLLVKWRLTKKENKIHDNSRSCGGG
jgi:hypothetical protein